MKFLTTKRLMSNNLEEKRAHQRLELKYSKTRPSSHKWHLKLTSLISRRRGIN